MTGNKKNKHEVGHIPSNLPKVTRFVLRSRCNYPPAVTAATVIGISWAVTYGRTKTTKYEYVTSLRYNTTKQHCCSLFFYWYVTPITTVAACKSFQLKYLTTTTVYIFSLINLHCYNWPGQEIASADPGGPVYHNLITNELIHKYIAIGKLNKSKWNHVQIKIGKDERILNTCMWNWLHMWQN